MKDRVIKMDLSVRAYILKFIDLKFCNSVLYQFICLVCLFVSNTPKMSGEVVESNCFVVKEGLWSGQKLLQNLPKNNFEFFVVSRFEIRIWSINQ